MALQFIGIDPATGDGNSPTVWVDPAKRELVIQGWKPDHATEAECRSFGVIPDHETTVRVPARIVAILREACDAAERAQLRDAAEV